MPKKETAIKMDQAEQCTDRSIKGLGENRKDSHGVDEVLVELALGGVRRQRLLRKFRVSSDGSAESPGHAEAAPEAVLISRHQVPAPACTGGLVHARLHAEGSRH